MKIYITAFPIDRDFQEAIGIYSTGVVAHVIAILVNHGYKEVQPVQHALCTIDSRNYRVNIARLVYQFNGTLVLMRQPN